MATEQTTNAKSPSTKKKIPKQKVYVVYLYAEEDSNEEMFIGVFDSRKRITEEIKRIENDIDTEISEDELRIIETNLNENQFC
ncbi:MAG: hypothetical protein LBT46_09020 [Planctomycetaceae bacterium]|jgi:hypothetical protein|nr:hypothetical protein [Planctomycetaceae bacterium]